MRRKMNLYPANYKLEFPNVAFGFSEYRRQYPCRSAASAIGSPAAAARECPLSLIPVRPLGNRNFAQCAEIGFKLRAAVRKSIRLQDKGDDVDVRVIADALSGPLRHRQPDTFAYLAHAVCVPFL